MAEYADLRGVRTWYDVHGAGEPLLLVHPGGVGVDSRAFGPNIPQLSEAFRVYTPDRRGHGRTPDVDGPITYESMAADTIEFITRVIGAPTRVLGMSDGAITALYVAMERPDLVMRLAFVAGVFHRDGLRSLPETPSASVSTSGGLVSGLQARSENTEREVLHPCVWIHDMWRSARPSSVPGRSRRARHSSRSTFVVVMQPADVWDLEDRTDGWRLDGQRNGSILV